MVIEQPPIASALMQAKERREHSIQQTSVLRTMEQILGMKPMNQFDAVRHPMSDCFTDTPDYTPFDSVPNRVPLDQMKPEPNAIRDPLLRENALVSESLNFREIDRAPEDVLKSDPLVCHEGERCTLSGMGRSRDAEEDDDDE